MSSASHAPSSNQLSPSQQQHKPLESQARRGGGREARKERSNGVRAPLQQLQQQGEEASSQEGPAQGADSQDPGQPRCAGRQEQLPKMRWPARQSRNF
ncbi:hypothetical protein ZWY2020_047158 [Hordeum vulgare]|nr:hypothetical protein ZWY2020_047158 [Hordeum vulgare]